MGAQDWTRTSMHVVHHPLKMACLPISPPGHKICKEQLKMAWSPKATKSTNLSASGGFHHLGILRTYFLRTGGEISN
jgi:hypothetical protein